MADEGPKNHGKIREAALRMMAELTARQAKIAAGLRKADGQLSQHEAHYNARIESAATAIEEAGLRAPSAIKIHRNAIKRRAQVGQLRGVIRGHASWKR